jgi:ribosomal protein S12 methylthiotransferase
VAAQREVTAEILAGFVGTTQRVLIEEKLAKSGDAGDDEVNYALGRAWFQAPEVDGSVLVPYDGDDPAPGKPVDVQILEAVGVDLVGRIVRELR